MNISDLNHLEVVEESNVIGGSSLVGNDYERIDVKVTFDFNNSFFSDVHLDGNTASAKALADAKGRDTKSDTFAQTYSDDWQSASVSIAGSATEGGYYYWY